MQLHAIVGGFGVVTMAFVCAHMVAVNAHPPPAGTRIGRASAVGEDFHCKQKKNATFFLFAEKNVVLSTTITRAGSLCATCGTLVKHANF